MSRFHLTSCEFFLHLLRGKWAADVLGGYQPMNQVWHNVQVSPTNILLPRQYSHNVIKPPQPRTAPGPWTGWGEGTTSVHWLLLCRETVVYRATLTVWSVADWALAATTLFPTSRLLGNQTTFWEDNGSSKTVLTISMTSHLTSLSANIEKLGRN